MIQVPNTEALDEHLTEVVNALHSAVQQGITHLDDSKIADKVIQDCQEILVVIMEGHVSEWLK